MAGELKNGRHCDMREGVSRGRKLTLQAEGVLELGRILLMREVSRGEETGPWRREVDNCREWGFNVRESVQ